jgi:hypothetical protein
MLMPLAVQAAYMLLIRGTNAMLRMGNSALVLALFLAATSHRPFRSKD